MGGHVLVMRLGLVPMPVSYADYLRARDFFDAVRDAAQDADRIAHALERMAAAEGVRAQGYEVRGRSGGTSDAMRRTDERIDWEERYRRRRDEDYQFIDLACDVIYGGQDQVSGGVGALLGPAYADCLWWRYCAAAPWPEVARGCDRSERWCRDAVRVALDVVDGYGLAQVAAGLGVAAS